MIPLAGLFRGVFLSVILLWYSLSVWHAMDEYYKEEFKRYIEKEYEKNKHLKADMFPKKYASEAESMGPVHGTTFQPQIGNIATSFTKSENADVIKENRIQTKQKHLQDTPHPSAPKLESELASTNSHISTVQSQSCQKENEISDVLTNKHKCT
jgi:hypothetical protein